MSYFDKLRNHSLQIEFFSVSKIENKNFIHQNYVNLQSFYPNSSYTVVSPANSINELREYFDNLSLNVSVLNENDLISFVHFQSLFRDVALSSGISLINLEGIRFGWYYQQILKLVYASRPQSSPYCVMIDADTILLRKLRFFDGETSIVYTTTYERNLPYRNFCEELFQARLKSRWFSATTQLFSLTPSERLSLLDKLTSYSAIRDSEQFADWITRVCTTVLFKTGKGIKLNDSLMSEQDIVSFSNCLNLNTKKINIIYIRSTKSFLSSWQMSIAARLGIAHVTYEQWLLDGSGQVLGLLAFLTSLIRAFIPYHYRVSALIKNCKRLIPSRYAFRYK
jgi:hypothetical protein